MSLGSIAERLARYSPLGHPVARRAGSGETFSREIAAGTPAPDALRSAGASDRVVAFVRAAAPADLPAVLSALASALGRAEDREREMRDAWLYPLSLAGAVTFLAAVVAGFVRPRLQAGASAAHGLAGAPSLPIVPVILAVIAAVALLLWLAAALRSASPRAPFAEAKRRAQRALVLAAADSATSGGVALPVALRAAAAMAPPGEVSSAAREIAAALERGDRGAGPAILGALAKIAEDDAAASGPFDVVRAEIFSLLLAASAIAIAGIAVISCYSEVFISP